jgi:hypothetical protein
MWYYGEEQTCTAFMGKPEDKGVVVERVLLKRSFEKQDGRTGFFWLSLGTGDRLL